MLKKKFTLIFFLALLQFSNGQFFSWTQQYPDSTNLDAGGHGYLAWDYDEYYITLELQVKSTGWIGVGLSSYYGMNGADMFVGWVKDGKAKITDRHGVGNSFPPLDDQQNVELLDAKEESGWTLLKFRRTIETCLDDDISLLRNTMTVIYAWGRSDPMGDDIVPADKHVFDGAKSIDLLGHLSRNRTAYPEGEQHDTFTVTSGGVTLPQQNTFYLCRLIPFPDVPGKRHIVLVEPWIQPGNEEYIHHVILTLCTDPIPSGALVNQSGECSTAGAPIDAEKCIEPLAVWDHGYEANRFPSNTGFPFGGAGDPKYIHLEIHYDNPDKLPNIVDNSGLRITFTSQLRQHDAGSFSTGRILSGLTTVIPPGAPSFPLGGVCSEECITNSMDNAGVEEIRVMAVMSHTHNLGRDITIRHFRGGDELPYLSNDAKDDFNSHLHYLQAEIIVKRGDSLKVECEYNSENRKNFTYGGLSVLDEMCFVYAFYYPRIPLASCKSQPTIDSMSSILSGYGVDPTFLMPKPTAFRQQSWKTIQDTSAAKTVDQILNEYTWNETTINLLNKQLSESRVMHICTTPRGRVASFFDALVVNNSYVPPPKQCNVTIEVTPGGGGGASFLSASYSLLFVHTFLVWLLL